MTQVQPVLIHRESYHDERGFFVEAFNQKEFEKELGYPVTFVQDNHSRSSQGVLRGLHYQLPPMSQGKLVRVVSGVIFDVAVDIRKASPGFGSWVGFELSDSNQHQLWVPSGFAHGFVVLSESADVVYKTTEFYSPDNERSIRWDDTQIGIEWPPSIGSPVVSPTDSSAPSLQDADLFE